MLGWTKTVATVEQASMRFFNTPYNWQVLSKGLCFVSIFLLASCFCLNVLRYAVDFPNADDFDSLLDFLNRFYQSDVTFDRFALLLERHTQHFRTLDRLLALLGTLIIGHFSVLAFIISGIIGLLFLYALLILPQSTQSHDRQHVPEKKTVSALFALSIALLFFQPSYVEVTQWANNSIQVIWINVWALLALRCARNSFWKTILYSTLALLTQGNGLLVLPVVSGFLVIEGAAARTLSYRYFLAFVTGLALFRYDKVFAQDGSHPGLHLIAKLRYAIEMLGSAFAFNSAQLAFCIGLLILFGLSFVLLSGHIRKDPLAGFSVFLVLSCLSTAHFRYDLDPQSSFTTGRYTLVSVLAFICLASLLRQRVGERFNIARYDMAAMAVGIVFFVLSYWASYDAYFLRYQLLNDSRLRWHLFSDGLAYPVPLRAKQILSASEYLGVFTDTRRPHVSDYMATSLPSGTLALNPEQADQSSQEHISKQQSVWSIEHMFCSSELLLVDGWTAFPELATNTVEVYLQVADGRLLEAKLRVRPDVTLHLTENMFSRRFHDTGFFLLVDRSDLLEISSHELTLISRDMTSGAVSTKVVDLKSVCS